MGERLTVTDVSTPRQVGGAQIGAWGRTIGNRARICRFSTARSGCSAARSTHRTSGISSPRSTYAMRYGSTWWSSWSPMCPGRRRAAGRSRPLSDRFAMVEAAVAEVPGLVPGRQEIDHGGNSYTADTLASLGRASSRAPSCSRSSVTMPPPACTRGRGTTRWSRSHTSWSSTARASPSSCRMASTGSVSRYPGSRCRAPTCGRGSPTVGRSTTSSPSRCST